MQRKCDTTCGASAAWGEPGRAHWHRPPETVVGAARLFRQRHDRLQAQVARVAGGHPAALGELSGRRGPAQTMAQHRTMQPLRGSLLGHELRSACTAQRSACTAQRSAGTVQCAARITLSCRPVGHVCSKRRWRALMQGGLPPSGTDSERHLRCACLGLGRMLQCGWTDYEHKQASRQLPLTWRLPEARPGGQAVRLDAARCPCPLTPLKSGAQALLGRRAQEGSRACRAARRVELRLQPGAKAAQRSARAATAVQATSLVAVRPCC